MHLGAVVVILAGMAGSQAGHRLWRRLGMATKVRQGVMALIPSQPSQVVRTPDGLSRLPFWINLRQVRIDGDRIVSEVEVIDADRLGAGGVRGGTTPLGTSSISVNHPLHYGGYYLHQHTAGEWRGVPVSVLMVRSDTGTGAALAGMVLLAISVAGHFYLMPLIRRLRRARATGPARASISLAQQGVPKS